MPAAKTNHSWKYIRGLAAPVLVLAALIAGLAYALYAQVKVLQVSDEENLREWIMQSRIFRDTLPQMVADYLQLVDMATPEERLALKAEEIHEHLKALGDPLKIYQRQLPLFPSIYRLEIQFMPPSPRRGRGAGGEGDADLRAPTPSPPPPLPREERGAWKPIVWDSTWPRDPAQVQTLNLRLHDGAVLRMEYHLHAYTKQEEEEARQRLLLLGLGMVVIAGFIAAAVWVYFFLRRERERELQDFLAQQQLDRAEKLALEHELRRKEVERRHDDMERRFLEQRVATHEAEQQALEIKSQLYASIGIMAGSYAHNIKNLLVRPNDLLRRCLEADGLGADQEHMLQEVRQTLGTVTERLQQILQTVRSDPSRSDLKTIDLNDLAAEVLHAWQDMAMQKWKLTLAADLCPGPLPIAGDRSHLMQAMENLLFNARDATFEMRNRVREEARRNAALDEAARRHAVLAAAGWKGEVRLRTRKQNDVAIFEVEDNGIGMTEEVRRRCVETHFSTKRDNALFEGNTTGMGLGLSFVQAILQHHRAQMEIISEPFRGTTFRLKFPV